MDSAEGLYINYLQVGKLIVAPQFGINNTDDVALATIKENVSSNNIATSINSN